MHEGGSLRASLFVCARGLGAKETEKQGPAGFRAPISRRPRAKKPAGLGVKGTEKQGPAGFRVPIPRRPRAKKPAGRGAPRRRNKG